LGHLVFIRGILKFKLKPNKIITKIYSYDSMIYDYNVLDPIILLIDITYYWLIAKSLDYYSLSQGYFLLPTDQIPKPTLLKFLIFNLNLIKTS